MALHELNHILLFVLLFFSSSLFAEDVGTIEGNFSVNENGAAIYEIPFDIFPSGTGFDPKVGLVYNSQQSCYGNAGYGTSISGISSITRAGKDRFHDGTVQKVRYEVGDNYVLDGKRLYLKSGAQGMDGSTYTVEGNPFVTVTLHGNDYKSNTTIWFELKDTDGNEYQYTQLLRCYFGHPSKTSQNIAWYITQAKNKYQDCINYTYTQSNNYIYPSSITYGRTGERHTISFSYMDLATPQQFVMEGGTTGSISKYLSSVEAKCQSNTFRRYSLNYNSSSDASQRKYTRISSINVYNNRSESLSPINFNWNHLNTASISHSSNNVNTQVYHAGRADEGESYFFSADLNNDGIGDIIRMWHGDVYDYYSSDVSRKHGEQNIYISKSIVDSNGRVTYDSPTTHKVPFSIDMGNFFDKRIKLSSGASNVCNIDGDELGDIILPYYNTSNGNNAISFCFLRGNYIIGGSTICDYPAIACPLTATADEVPFYVTLDLDNDGKDEIVYIENKKHNAFYHGMILSSIDIDNYAFAPDSLQFTYSQNATIARTFLADCNADGLQDIILVFDNGYKIYFNNGGSDLSSVFTQSNTKEVTNSASLKNYWRMEQGDFNGDGLLDFVVNVKGEAKLGFLFNNGNGTFTMSTKTDVDFADETDTGRDDDYFAVRVVDFDKDGLSDVFISKKQMYDASSWYETSYYRMDKAQVRLFRSDGTKPVLWQSIDKNTDDIDCKEANIFVGDFNGDGYAEVANYGSPLNSSTNNTFTENSINIYSFPTGISLGRICSIDKRIGKSIHISYSSGTNPSVYTKQDTNNHTFPVNTYTLPIPLVSSTSQSNGAAETQYTSYSYKDLIVHMQGRGLIGFSSTETYNSTLGVQTERKVASWNQKWWLPSSVMSTTTIDDQSSTSISTNTVVDTLYNGNYFCYTSADIDTDIYGYKTRKEFQYALNIGVPTMECTYYDVADGDSVSDMFKKTEYISYNNYCGKYLPDTVVHSQKHTDDNNIYYVTDNYTYNSKGDVTSKINSSRYINNTVNLTTSYIRDSYGNVTSELTSGNNVSQVYKLYDYDNKKLRLLRSYTNPSSTVITYQYDSWGNVTSKRDESNASNILTTNYVYDNWGRLKKTTAPDGIETIISPSWNNTVGHCAYSIVTKDTGKAPVIRYYDSEGREVLITTYTVLNRLKKKTIYYSRFGTEFYSIHETDQLRTSESKYYDSFGRILSVVNDNSGNTSYSYGNDRSVTIAAPTGTTVKIYDAWGNITCSSDNASSVNYTYNSMGLPIISTSGENSVTMQYDGAGRKTMLTDPDAGTVTYSYAADGTLLSQTDGRGITTTFTYDNIGRLVTMTCGNTVETTSYGSYGYGKNRIIRKERSNGVGEEYDYDSFGRIIEKRKYDSDNTFTTQYEYYSDNGLLKKVTYPGNVVVDYEYDSFGYLKKIYANNTICYSQGSYNGLKDTKLFRNLVCNERLYPSTGLLAYRTIGFSDGNELDRINYSYSPATKNVEYRWRGPLTDAAQGEWNSYIQNGGSEYVIREGSWSADWLCNDNIALPKPNENYYKVDRFYFDNSDRLICTQNANSESDSEQEIEYDSNGNITYKSGIGTYDYYGARPHAVSSISNPESNMTLDGQSTIYNDEGKISQITSNSSTYNIIYRYFTYGPDADKWKTIDCELTRGAITSTTTSYYDGAYERVEKNNNVTEYYFIENDVILIKKNGALKAYKAFCDNQGSILSVFDEDGNKVFEASYDAWGRQTVVQNEIDLHYGYCGHEMLADLNLIDMGGRVYDPVIGRFLSCDNYVQAPDNSQNFNRYSYCLNNPLRYTDPSGEFILGTLISGIIDLSSNLVNHGFNVSQYNWSKTINAWRIDTGMFQGNLSQVLSKWTWELPQSIIGNITANGANILGKIDNVTHMDGMLALSNVTNGEAAFTIGFYSFGPKGYVADWRDHLFVHEYGHYIQSRYVGPFYLPVIGVISLSSAALAKKSHKYRWTEIWANRLASEYFDEKYGMGHDGYIKGSPLFFDKRSFVEDVESPYINPRKMNKNLGSYPILVHK